MTHQHSIDSEVDQQFRAWQVVVDACAIELWNLALDTGLSETEAARVCELVWLRLLEAFEGGLLPDRMTSLHGWIMQTLLLESYRMGQVTSWRTQGSRADQTKLSNARSLESGED